MNPADPNERCVARPDMNLATERAFLAEQRILARLDRKNGPGAIRRASWPMQLAVAGAGAAVLALLVTLMFLMLTNTVGQAQPELAGNTAVRQRPPLPLIAAPPFTLVQAALPDLPALAPMAMPPAPALAPPKVRRAPIRPRPVTVATAPRRKAPPVKKEAPVEDRDVALLSALLAHTGRTPVAPEPCANSDGTPCPAPALTVFDLIKTTK